MYVISEYAFAKEIGDAPIELSEEHDAFQCVTIEQAYSMLRYDSNKTALYELFQLFKSRQFWQRGYDCVAPVNHWEFNSDVSQVFHNMLRRSIPELEMMRDLVTLYGSRFVKPNTTIIDLGCSCGDSLLPFVRKFGVSNHYIGIDQSEAMLKQAEFNFHNEEKSGIMELLNLDLCLEFPQSNACLILSVLTMQFIPVERRKKYLQQIYSSLLPDGALILVEKIKGRDAFEENILTELYYELKNIQGYSWQSIERKRMSLQSTMMPSTIECNIGLLHESGFKRVDCFWRCLNFAAWIAIK